ncbi:Transmembrane protein [Halotydeus destructor]|nr:Transmembrane protein [Halotydeus destructor]
MSEANATDIIDHVVISGSTPTKGSAWPLIAGLFAWLALGISVWEISHHLMNYNKPYLQKYVIRILWMVPIYAMNSWLGMQFPSTSIYFDTLRECYEAFVIYSFMKYLLNFLYREMEIDTVIDCKPSVKHMFPLCWLDPLPGGRIFLHKVKHGVLQYTVVRPVTTFIALLSEAFGIYGEGSYTFTTTYPYLLMVNNISQMVAMYCLVIFYTAYKYELSPMKPLAKFLCIKAVVFFSFFQGVVISFLLEFGMITHAFVVIDEEDTLAIGRNLQDFLICFEMMLAALAHLYAFSHGPFIDLAASSDPCCYSFIRAMDVSDERTDITDHLRQVYLRARDTWKQRKTSSVAYGHETAPLIAMQPRGNAGRFPSSSGRPTGPPPPPTLPSYSALANDRSAFL